MFGDNIMLGEVTHKLDCKGRVSVPKRMTGVEASEKLILTADGYLISSSDVERRYSWLKNDSTLSFFERKKEMENLREVLNNCVVLNVDCSGRITLPDAAIDEQQRDVVFKGDVDRVKVNYKSMK